LAQRFFYFFIFLFRFLQKYIFILEIYRNIPGRPDAGRPAPGRPAAGRQWKICARTPGGQAARQRGPAARPGVANGQAARLRSCSLAASRARGTPAPLRGSAGAQGGRTAGRGLHRQLQRRTGPAAAAQVQRQRATTTAHRLGMN